MSDSTYSADRDDEFIEFGSYHEMIKSKHAIHKCVIEGTWNEGDSVPGFEIPKGCQYAKASLRDAKIHLISGDLICVFDIILLFGDKDSEFIGWR